MKRSRIYQFLPVFILFVPMLLYRKAATSGIIGGIRIAGTTVIPALFPYFVVSNLLLGSHFSFPKWLQRGFSRLFRTSAEGLFPFVFSLIGGYPLGARTVSVLYEEKRLRKQDAESLLTFCNNTGPAFFIAVAGGEILGSIKAGILLYFIHMMSAVLCGVLLRRSDRRLYCVTHERQAALPFSRAFPQAVLQASTSMLNISAFVILFAGFQSAIDAVPFIRQGTILFASRLHVPRSVVQAVFSGFLEMTSGIVCLQGVQNKLLVFSLLSCLISWGGMCVHFQTISQLNNEISNKGYYSAKLLQSLLSVLLAMPVGALLYRQTIRPGLLLGLLLITGAVGFACKAKCKSASFARSGKSSAKINLSFSRKKAGNSEKNLV